MLTGALSALAVQLGIGMLSADVEEAAIEDQVSLFQGSDALIVGVDAQDVSAEAVFGDDDEVGGEVLLDELAFDVEDMDGFELDFVRATIGEFGLLPALADAFGTADGRVALRLSSGVVVVIDQRGIVDTTTNVVADTAVDATSITNLGGTFFDAPSASTADRQFAFVERTIDGQSLGFVVDITDGQRAVDEVANALWLSAAVLTVLAGAAAWILVGRALAPVGAITRRVDAIRSGSLDDRVPVPRQQDEIGVLATTMNAMLGRLETGDLRRRQFVSDASHELRTPVAVLQSEAEVAKRAPETTNVEDLAAVVLTESKRLGVMVEDLLSLARDDEGQPRALSTNHVDVDEVVLAESQRSRGVNIDRSGISAGRIVGRTDDVERAVAHLIDNASRHARNQVAVGVSTWGSEVVCWVDDDGPGIKMKHRERVFRRFVRLDDARSRDRGGAGLGLAVVQTTVASMGGAVSIEDSSLGGARLLLRWPAA